MTREQATSSKPQNTVFLRPSFSITTRDGALNVAVRAAPAGASASLATPNAPQAQA
jgi:hypothetical protein